MPDYFYIGAVAENGKTTSLTGATQRQIFVRSDEVMPVDFDLGDAAFIVDKFECAFCDGKGNWYRKADTPVAGGQPWSALF